MDLRRAAVRLREALRDLGTNEDVKIKTGKPGEMTVWVDGRLIFDHAREAEVGTGELVRRVAQAKATP